MKLETNVSSKLWHKTASKVRWSFINECWAGVYMYVCLSQYLCLSTLLSLSLTRCVYPPLRLFNYFSLYLSIHRSFFFLSPLPFPFLRGGVPSHTQSTFSPPRVHWRHWVNATPPRQITRQNIMLTELCVLWARRLLLLFGGKFWYEWRHLCQLILSRKVHYGLAFPVR